MGVHTAVGADELVEQAVDQFVTGLDLLIEVVEAGGLARYANPGRRAVGISLVTTLRGCAGILDPRRP